MYYIVVKTKYNEIKDIIYKMEVNKMKLWLVVKDTDTKRTWWKYFNKESDMDKFIHKIKYVKNLILIEDSRDIIYI